MNWRIDLIRTVLSTVLAALMASATFPAYAGTEVAGGYRCTEKTSPEKVVRTFIDRGVIDQKPYQVLDQVRSYAAKPGNSAFGFPLVAVIGWQEDSRFFGRGPGTPPPVHFALVVRASEAQLTEAARQRGIEALPLQAAAGQYPTVRVSAFTDQGTDTLPAGADLAQGYALMSCNPRP